MLIHTFIPHPDLESTIVCNCSNLTRALAGNHGNSAPVWTKLKCNSHFIMFSFFFLSFFYIMPHSLNNITKAALVFTFYYYFFSSFAKQSLLYFIGLGFLFYFLFPSSLRLLLELQKDSWPVIGVKVSPVSLCVCACMFVCVYILPAVAQLAGKYWALTPRYHFHHPLQRLTDLCCQTF